MKRTLQWLGHAMRIPNHRYQSSYAVRLCTEGRLATASKPKGMFSHTNEHMLRRVGLDKPTKWLT